MTRATVDLSAPIGNIVPKLARRALCFASLLIASLAATPASALIVMNFDPSNNYVAPTAATNVGPWGANADPGWANSTSRGVYLGNGWILSAAHTGLNNNTSEAINGESYAVIRDTRTDIKNPTALVNAGVAALADLRLIRVNTLSQFDGSPEQRAAALELPLQPIHLATSRLPTDRQLVAIGRGRIKADGAALIHADTAFVSGQAPNWPSFTPCVNCFHTLDANTLHAVGYNITTTTRKAWGTNQVENPSTVANSVSDFVSKGGTWVSGTTAAQAFDFDTYTSFTMDASGNVISGGGNEIQAAANDSGGGVYAWNAAMERWELGGVMHSVARYGANNQALAIRRGTTPSGDLTIFSDISVYRTQIEAYMAPPVGYEWNGEGADTRFFHMPGRNVSYDAAGALVVTEGLWGDINLDGVVSGDGSGSWATDDVTAFVQGWGYQQDSGDILSWKRGDMNQDGRVDLDDFLLLRQGVQQASGASLSLSALLGTSSQVVPEPATAGILAAAGLGLLAWRRLRRAH